LPARFALGEDTSEQIVGSPEVSEKLGHAHFVRLDTRVSDRLADRMIAGHKNRQTFYARSHESDNLITFVS
jgi:hypothetical protein